MKPRISMLVVSLASVFVQQVLAQSSIPFTNSFESLGLGESILTNPAAGSWDGTAESKAIVTNADSVYSSRPSMMFPVPSETHTNILRFETDGTISNSFAANSLLNLWVDTMVQPVLSEETPLSASITNSQLSVCFGTNGYVNIFHGVHTNPATFRGQLDLKSWSTFSNSAFRITSSQQWVRLTIEMHYDVDFAYAMFKARVDGIVLSNEFGYSGNDLQTATESGPWFLCANDTSLENGLRLNEVALSGSGYLDDLLVSTSEPTFGFDLLTATNGVPYIWLVANVLGTNVYPQSSEGWDLLALGDLDVDGMLAWEEWVAGTDPSNSNSLLKVSSQSISNGLSVISWLSSANTLSNRPYTFQTSSNLFSLSGWSSFTSTPANVTGTKTLIVAPPSTSPTFYRVTITN
jgi:hypothetical protein